MYARTPGMDSCNNIKGGRIMEKTIIELKRLKRSLNRKFKPIIKLRKYMVNWTNLDIQEE